MRTIHKEIIGLAIKVVDSKNRDNLGLEGQVIDETQNTLKIKTKRGPKELIKENITFIIQKTNQKIKGSQIAGRPEERIKK